jgi:eukaryotic-like serine/threonine-protein kinase
MAESSKNIMPSIVPSDGTDRAIPAEFADSPSYRAKPGDPFLATDFGERSSTPMPVTGVGLPALDEGFSNRSPAYVTPSAEGAAVEQERRLVLAGKYVIERELARGAMGRVYLAKQMGLNRQVAIKVMSPKLGDDDFRRRFILEATSLANLNHRNIVTVFDYGETKRGMLYLVMEHLNGKTLAKLMRDDGTLTVARSMSLTSQLLRGLRAAHGTGMIHRDFKPSNIMVMQAEDGEEDAKILDFGVAKLFRPGEAENADATRDGMLLGTPAYMAPEQIDGSGIGPRTDLYALGCVMYQMLAGRLPHTGKNDVEIMHAHLKEQAAPLRTLPGLQDLPAPMEAFVARLLEKNADQRFADAAAALEALRTVTHTLLTQDASFRASVSPDFSASMSSTGGDKPGSSGVMMVASREPTTPTPVPQVGGEWSGPNDSGPSSVPTPALAPNHRYSDPVVAPRRLGWMAAAIPLLLIGAAGLWWFAGRGTTIELETMPAGLTLLDSSGRKLGVSPVSITTKEAVLQVRAMYNGETSPLQDVVVGDGTVMVDFRGWSVFAPPAPVEAVMDAPSVTPPATTTVSPPANKPIRDGSTNRGRDAVKARPPSSNKVQPKIEVGNVDEPSGPTVDLVGRGKQPGVGLLEEAAKPTVGTLD